MTILFFNQVNAADIEKVGGKGANLGEMSQAGFPVPPGFCIATDAYQRMISRGNLYPQIETLLNSSINSLAESAKRIQEMILGVSFPDDLAKEIENAYRKLAKEKIVPVAVRSSATAEDLPEASFAGQQETYLGIRGERELLRHTQLCWASLWTERAISYRQRNGFPHQQVSLSVVVQAMVEPETAGVLFTANPLNGNGSEMLVNASYGLGESVVSGQITPDSYRLSVEAEALIIEKEVGAKETRIDQQASGGTRTTPIPEEDRQRLCLDSTQLEKLVELGSKVQNHYEIPQDIEWAFAGEELFLLQTRPITSINEAPKSTRKLSKVEHRILDDILEHYPDPPYPLDYYAVTEGYEQVQSAMREAGMKAAKSDQIIRMDEEGIPFVEPVVPKPGIKILALPLLLYKKMHLNPEDWQKTQSAFFAERISSLKKVELKKKSDAELARFIVDAVQIGTDVGTLRFGTYIAPMMIRGALLIAWVKLINKDKNIIEADLLGELDYKTALIDRALDDLAREAGKEKIVRTALLEFSPEEVIGELQKTEVGLQFLEKVNAFLEEHGARTMKVYLPFSNYSWREKPENLMAVLPLILRSVHKKDKTEGKFSALREKTTDRLPSFLRKSFLRTLTRYRNGHIAREATLYAIEEAFSLARQGTKEAARRLFNEGILSKQDDILLLTLPELYDLLKGNTSSEMMKDLVIKRQKARPKASAIWQDRGIVDLSTSKNMIKGQSGSPGLASGKVRVINGPAEFYKLNEGDVLVCQFTDPAWTPLFGLASAVVADTGGALSHAAIVAREYGIPAVLGTQVATTQLKDDMLIRVDGTQGMVFLD